ncbi:MAG TPA: methylated-DNA--[protein]-cysteine S-methyltransferase [Limnochordales bacterium]
MRYACLPSPLGPVFLAWSSEGLCAVSLGARDQEQFRRELEQARPGAVVEACRDPGERESWRQRLDDWFAGRPVPVALDLQGLTPFQRAVLQEVARIPRGQTLSYREVARRVGKPGAARAVGQVMAKNPVPLFVPCHRVVRADGGLGEYSGGGPAVKRRLLELEGAQTGQAGRAQSGTGRPGARAAGSAARAGRR